MGDGPGRLSSHSTAGAAAGCRHRPPDRDAAPRTVGRLYPTQPRGAGRDHASGRPLRPAQAGRPGRDHRRAAHPGHPGQGGGAGQQPAQDLRMGSQQCRVRPHLGLDPGHCHFRTTRIKDLSATPPAPRPAVLSTVVPPTPAETNPRVGWHAR